MTNESHNSAGTNLLLPQFGEAFLEDHARKMINDPKIALVELVANCWDAGADQVSIQWPIQERPDSIVIRDNGIGMTPDEFKRRWLYLNYDRLREQGVEVVFPTNDAKRKRTAFGRNGKGRMSVFCFANEYEIETIKEREYSKFLVKKTSAVANTPYTVELVARQKNVAGHGTAIKAELSRNYLKIDVVRDLLGSKFVADPSFHISLNNEAVELTDIEHLADSRSVIVAGVGTIVVRRFDSRETGRTSKQHGVAWWVNKRLVGEPSWRGFDEVAYLDARTSEAKRYTFVVEADALVDDVAADWSQFRETERVHKVREAVNKHILDRLRDLMRDVHRARKVAALNDNRKILRELPPDSQHQIGEFVDEIQRVRPSIDQRELSLTIRVLSNLEKTRSGYALMEQLGNLRPHDLDALHEILKTWSVAEARVVLRELEWRLKLVARLESLVENPSADELHEIHPLFEKGLWIFGPEYESPSFASNKTLLRVVTDFLGGGLKQPLAFPRQRSDIVALPDSTLSVYASDSYDEHAEVNGYDKILLLELKRGGFRIGLDEVNQIERYIVEIQKSGKVQESTSIIGYVLGATLDDYTRKGPRKIGDNVFIYPRAYSVILRQAHARTFDLIKKIQHSKEELLGDPEVAEVLGNPEQKTLFGDNAA